MVSHVQTPLVGFCRNVIDEVSEKYVPSAFGDLMTFFSCAYTIYVYE